MRKIDKTLETVICKETFGTWKKDTNLGSLFMGSQMLQSVCTAQIMKYDKASIPYYYYKIIK